MDECSVRHDFHPGLHLLCCVSAEVIGPHVGVSGLRLVEKEKGISRVSVLSLSNISFRFRWENGRNRKTKKSENVIKKLKMKS